MKQHDYIIRIKIKSNDDNNVLTKPRSTNRRRDVQIKIPPKDADEDGDNVLEKRECVLQKGKKSTHQR